MAGAPSTSGTTVKTCSGSRPAPIGSVYLPSAPRARPGTSEDGSGCRIHVVQPSRFRPFQSGVQPFSALAVIVASSAAIETTASREANFMGRLTNRIRGSLGLVGDTGRGQQLHTLTARRQR